jgi:hypothetical protein
MQVQAPSPSPNRASKVSYIEAMGFPRDCAEAALEATRGGLDAAVDKLLTAGAGRALLEAALSPSSPAAAPSLARLESSPSARSEILDILSRAELFLAVFSNVRTLALKESVRHCKDDEILGVFAESILACSQILQQQKEELVELALICKFDELRAAVNCPPRVPSPRTVSSFSEGQQVQVWSNSANRWEDGEVVQIVQPSQSMLMVRYGDPPRDKLLDETMVARDLRPDAAVESFRTHRDMVLACFSRSRKIAGLPVERRRMLGAAILAQTSIEGLRALALRTLETSQAFDGLARDLVANDIFDNRFDRLLLPDRFDCDAEPSMARALGDRSAPPAPPATGLPSPQLVPCQPCASRPLLRSISRSPSRLGGSLGAEAEASPLIGSLGAEAEVSAAEDQDCAVCLGPLNSTTASLPCRHTFCRECILGWARSCPRGPRCPLCRAPFDPGQFQ